MFCSNCGADAGSDKFCAACGSAVKPATKVSTASTATSAKTAAPATGAKARRGADGASIGSANPATYSGMNMSQAVRSFFFKYAGFEGRATRSEFWYVELASVLVGIAIWIVMMFILMISGGMYLLNDPYYGGDAMGTAGLLMLGFMVVVMFAGSLALILPSIAIQVRRLHDIGLSGWFVLLFLIPGGALALLIMAIIPSQEMDNAYGPAPVPAPADLR